MKNLNLVMKNGCCEAARTYTPLVAIYADASCLRNGSPDSSAGCGAVIIDRNRTEMKLLAKYLGPATNQQAEILACATALEELRRPCRVEIISDSRYVIDTMTGRNRMKTNRTFWNQLVRQSYGHHISWKWVKGHDGVTFQEVADRLARAASTARTNLACEDLEYLAEILSNEGGSVNIRFFEIEIDKITSRYQVFGDTTIPVPNLNGLTAFPSAFSG
ncbi:MAG: ribonuclease HI [Pyrinomonadaceae bacterium]